MKDIKPNYFSHDTNSSNDPKLVHIRMSFGWKAIGMYWAIIEALHKEENGELPERLISSMILDFYSQEEVRTMSHQIEEAREFESALYTVVLLTRNEGITTSKRVKENLREIKSKSDSARRSVMVRWGKKSNIKQKNTDTNEIRSNYERNTLNESKVNESKVKNITQVRGDTPAQIMREFLESIELQEKLASEISSKYNCDLVFIKNEVIKFIHYWTEPTKSGKQQRWETQPTFELKRRLATWLNNIKSFNNKIQIYGKVNYESQ